jgi:hypothetical protein
LQFQFFKNLLFAFRKAEIRKAETCHRGVLWERGLRLPQGERGMTSNRASSLNSSSSDNFFSVITFSSPQTKSRGYICAILNMRLQDEGGGVFLGGSC